MEDREARVTDSSGTIIGLMQQTEKRCGSIEDASSKMHELMARCREYGGKGKMTISFDVAPDKNEEGALIIDIYAKATLPEKPRRKALVFHDPKQKKFSRTDPRQMEMLEERQERERDAQRRVTELSEQGIARIGRGAGE